MPLFADYESPTEAAITSDFVEESQMKADILEMFARFATYLKNDFQSIEETNSVGEIVGCFKGENTMGSNEKGVRPNADLSMICAFLVKYGKGNVELPTDVTWEEVDSMAIQSLRYSYSTHKANQLLQCADGKYWGSLSNRTRTWESSLWAMSVAYSAFFQWNRLTDAQKQYVYELLKAECNYELERQMETGYEGDTKAEENGWEADVLAATLGLFPNDELAPQWFNRLREFAINSLSHPNDESDKSVIDPDYDDATVGQLYIGPNLYEDYTLQNHNYFHTSYQNVVIQELGEAALALKLFQQGLYGAEKWKTNALMHNCDNVMKQVLNWLALADGELAMPNGNDWSLFLYDQITSYSTSACFLNDPDALMLENLAYKMIKARQSTTEDGSWLLRPDVGARRMGVEAHRVMMTWLMHEVLSTADLNPTNWPEFNCKYGTAKVFDTQNIVRASTDDRFTCFSWATGIKSYTGYIAANSVDRNKIIVPFKKYNTGNFLGWYNVSGCDINATPAVPGIYELAGNSYVMNGELNTNDSTLNHRFSIFSTPGNAVIYMDNIVANKDATILQEKGGLMGISVDEFTNIERTLYSESSTLVYSRDDANLIIESPWINIDDALGIVASDGKKFFIGDVANNNSIYTAQLCPLYSDNLRTVVKGDLVDNRICTYYSNASSTSTKKLSGQNLHLMAPYGWNGCVVADADSTRYLFLSNFLGENVCKVENVKTSLGCPVFKEPTSITLNGSCASFQVEQNHSVTDALRFFIQGGAELRAVQKSDGLSIQVLNAHSVEAVITVNVVSDNGIISKTIVLPSNQEVEIALNGTYLEVIPSIETGVRSANIVPRYSDLLYDVSGRRISHASVNHTIYISGKKKILR